MSLFSRARRRMSPLVSRWSRILVALSAALASIVISTTTQTASASGTIWEAKINAPAGFKCFDFGGQARFMAGSSPNGVDITGWSITGGSSGDPTRTVIFPGGDTLKVINDCAVGEALRFRNTFGSNTMKVDGVIASWTIGASGDWAGIEYYDLPVGSSISITFDQAGQWGSLWYMYYEPSRTGITPGTTPGVVTYPVTSNPTDYIFESTAPPSPTVTTVNPTSGDTAGGTEITITGTNFANGATVTVGGAACTNVTVVNATEITCTTPAGTAGTASVVVTANGLSNSANTLFTYIAPPTTTAPATTTTTVAVNTTTATTTTVAVNTSSTPTLVTSSNQAALTSRPGSATILINGTAVTPEVVSVAESVAAQVPPTQRTAAQISQLQDAAQQITQQLDTIAGGDSGVNVINTSTGAVLTGVFEGQRVPVEDVVVVQAQQTATLFAARDSRGNIVEVQPGAVLEVNADGDVAVQAFGLPAGESVELVLMSTPTLLGSFVVDAKGTVKTTADVPASIGAGNHTLVVATPSIQASLGLKVVKPISQLPNTGSSLTLVNWGVAVALLGAYLVLVSNTRRRRFQI